MKGTGAAGEGERIGKRLHLGRFYTDILFLLSRLPRAERCRFSRWSRDGTGDARSRKINVATPVNVEFMTIERS